MLHKTKIDLPAGKRELLVNLLNAQLAHLIDLQLQTKQAHWNVKGPSFIALHELFDDISEEILEHIDSVAERITALGGVAEGTLPAVAKRSGLEAYPLDISEGLDHVAALSSALAATGTAMRASIDEATAHGDAGTADLFTGVSRDLDKQLWFVEAHLQGGPPDKNACSVSDATNS